MSQIWRRFLRILLFYALWLKLFIIFSEEVKNRSPMGKTQEIQARAFKENKMNVLTIVLLRTYTSMQILISGTLMTIATFMQPWLYQHVEGKTSTMMELSLWNLCRLSRKRLRCWPQDMTFSKIPAWFHVFRTLTVISYILVLISFLFILYKLLTTKTRESRKFWIPALLCFMSTILTFIAQFLVVGYSDLDFLDDSRMSRMGWVPEVTDYPTGYGWPWYLTWGCFVVNVASVVLCVYTHVRDERFSKSFRSNSRSNSSNRLIQK